MELSVNSNVQLRTIDHENADLLFPLLKEDLKEISQWFSIEEDYKLEYEHEYVEEKDPPYDETFVIYYNGEPCGRVGLYDYDQSKDEIFLYYWVAHQYRRKHIAIDSILRVMDYLGSLGLKNVLFDVKKRNEYSIALIKHLPGAVLREEKEDFLIYCCPLRSRTQEDGNTLNKI